MNKETTYRTTTITIGNATVSIHRPILTDSEKVKVTEGIVLALSRYGKAVIGEMKQ